ncbi:transporter substrate-binding domain-containing protein [Orenia marismortui]|uniref:transporter substrate-binding domain-containing protein n=1 Tax=Orenia marismortui TaxID=46469 RepID=UPI000379964F|nr:transporter substrate-binding domain-containing protein [Orenia marismortui]
MKKQSIVIFSLMIIMSLIIGCTSNQANDKKTLQVGVEGTYPPFNFETEDGKLTGYDVEVAREIANRIGYKIKFIPTKWSGMFGALEAKKFDIIVNQVAITPERQEKYDFSEPYVYSGAQLIVKSNNNKIRSLKDLKGKKVGVGLGSNYEQIIKEFDQNNKIEVKTYEVLLDTLNDLDIGRIDAALNDKLAAGINIKKTGLDLKVTGKVVKKVVNGITLRKGNKQLLNKINNALAEMKSDGTLKEISLKWFGVDVSH